MMVTFVSQCEKKSLNRTRRVLDAFANRIGNRTWQTVITNEGLQAVKKLLRKTASKNTAVSCHWMRSRSRSELVWVVGNRGKFDVRGIVPVNTTQKTIMNTQWENDWYYLPLIKSLTAVAALFHDWGKASELFQAKLNPKTKNRYKGDPLRHEWISCLLLKAFIQSTNINSTDLNDASWLEPLARGELNESKIKSIVQQQTKLTISPLSNLPPMAKLIAWLIVSHHRLPLKLDKNFRAESAENIDDILEQISKEWGYENNYDEAEYTARVQQCFNFPHGLMSQSRKWLKEVRKWSQRLMDCENLAIKALNDGSYWPILSYSRLCLMLGDHYYSSQDAAKKWQDNTGLFANTDRAIKGNPLKQKLDEHLFGVAKQGVKNAYLLPAFEIEPPRAKDVKVLKQLSLPDYRWQDKAVDKIKQYLTDNTERQGFFVVNMASTGKGKTFANAKVMRALSVDGDSLRFVLALGLRTLTLQTGNEYRKRVDLDESELAVLIGSRAVMELNKQSKIDEEDDSYERSGSISEESLLAEEIDFDCDIPEEGLATVLRTKRDRQFLYAPVLACTIDHLMAATETKRGGRYILPSLRLMSSDLVIDEIDDFTGSDLIAIGRLIHLAGMLGRKVMISSATIPPDLAEGYFNAYREGWQLFCKTRNASLKIACAWIDEFTTHVVSNTELEPIKAIPAYREQHKKFANKRVAKLLQQPIKRKAEISSCESIFAEHKINHNDEDVIESKQQAYFKIIAQSAFRQHANHHAIDKQSQLKVSFGVVRVANIRPCIALTKYLLNTQCPVDTEIRVMAYHSQQVLLLRHEQEKHLDKVLKRKEAANESPKAFSNSVIRQHLDPIHSDIPSVKNVVFILVATPVEEVGRDHDFDWAVVEPSSYRSIIQLAGRVRRHRTQPTIEPNVALLQYNWRGIRNRHRENIKVFNRPGFEDEKQLESHDLNDLIDVAGIGERLDAIPRIKKNEPLQATKKLADLEHYATKALLAIYKSSQKSPKSLQGYLKQAWFLTAFPQKLAPFRAGPENINVYLVFNEDEQDYFFCEKNATGFPINREKVLGINRHSLSEPEKKRLWLTRDFNSSIEHLADTFEKSKRSLSIRYGELNFPKGENASYDYNDQLGLVRV